MQQQMAGRMAEDTAGLSLSSIYWDLTFALFPSFFLFVYQ